MPHRPHGAPENRRSSVTAETEVAPLYEAAAEKFDRVRHRFGGEERYLAMLLDGREPKETSVLDLGCGTGQPIARFFIERGCRLTGIDAAPAMIALCRERFPQATWIVHDMRTFDLKRRFDAIVAWDSFFHLPQADQRAMFPLFRRHTAPGGMLLFTSGVAEGEAIGDLFGAPLYHSSLDTEEYRSLLAANNFEVLLHRVEDPDCGRHTVWMGRAMEVARRLTS